MRHALLVFLLAPALAAPGKPTAAEIFRKAVLAQGKLRADQIKDVTLAFTGEISEKGSRNTARRTYWYRAKDAAFRMRTASGAITSATTERGILGEQFWERTSRGRMIELRPGNRDDDEAVRAIVKERRDFQRILEMVLLTRMDNEKWTITFAAPEPVRLENDFPKNLKGTLRDRAKETYFVLDARREGEARLKLFVHTRDHTVHKVEQYYRKAPDQLQWVYYFGPFRTDHVSGLTLPLHFSVYRQTPTDKKRRDTLLFVWGEPKISVNSGLKDEHLKPPAE